MLRKGDTSEWLHECISQTYPSWERNVHLALCYHYSLGDNVKRIFNLATTTLKYITQ
nr:MAG TPA: hypothetical protein [Caudoviricetes sp.]